MMMSSTKYEMMYQARKISSKIIMHTLKNNNNTKTNRINYLKKLNDCRFEVGYYDKSKNPIYNQIAAFNNFDKPFSSDGDSCYAVLRNTTNPLGIDYIVLKEKRLSQEISNLRMKIISYLVLSFFFMGIVGYFLARLFLAPVRNKIESLDKFIIDTTHELNTPISAILMTIHSLKSCDDRNDRKLKRLEASAKRLSTMYGSLTYGLQDQKREQHIESILLSDIVQERVEYIRELILSKHLQIKLNLTALTIKIDRESAMRLIDNLLSNAIKYSDPQGLIEITITGESLIVSDQGIGIDPALQKDIFRRYKRANKERGGFGIGLDIVLTICKRYGIRIELESELGKGSKFILYFPNT